MPPASTQPPARPSTRPAAGLAPRGFWLRSTMFVTLLGAVMVLVYTWMGVHSGGLEAMDGSGGGALLVLVPVLAAVTVAGVMVLERAAATGLVMMLVGTGLGLGNGTAWLIPGVILAAIWAAGHNARARVLLGFLLLVPGVAGGYYGAVGTLGFLSHVPLDGLLPNLGQPLGLRQALAPLELLPLALLGAWLLTPPAR